MTRATCLVPAPGLRHERSIGRLEESCIARHPASCLFEIGQRQLSQLARCAGCIPIELHVMRARCHHHRPRNAIDSSCGRVRIVRLDPARSVSFEETIRSACHLERHIIQVTDDIGRCSNLCHRAMIRRPPGLMIVLVTFTARLR